MTLRGLVDWHEQPALRRWAATAIGRVALLALVVPLLPDRVWTGGVAVALGLCFFLPAHRAWWLGLGGVAVLLHDLPESRLVVDSAPALAGAATPLLLLGGLFLLARRFPDWPEAIRRRPLAAFHLAWLGALALIHQASGWSRIAGHDPLTVSLVVVEALLPWLLWRGSYLVLSARRGSLAASRAVDHLIYLTPLWGGSPTPIGKGHDDLSRRRADDADELAASRLAGFKLLLLAQLWIGVRILFDATLHGAPARGLPTGWEIPDLDLPTLHDLLRRGPWRHDLATRWASVVLDLPRTVLDVAINGHGLVAVVRLAGYRIFRNTYKPLLATSVVEFWNRYYYFFKELLVEFFFYPVFVATGRYGQRVRIFLAVFAAAGVGNLYYHLVRDLDAYFGPTRWDLIASRSIYCAGLATGIFVSMVREKRRRGSAGEAPGRLGALRAVAGVWLFYALLHVWNASSTRFGVDRRWEVMRSLFVP